MKIVIVLLYHFLIHATSVYSQSPLDGKLKGKRILVFTKNGKGYVHDNIASSIAAFLKMAKDFKFIADTTTNPALFTDNNLRKYDALIFSNTNNDVFETEEQRFALMRYIRAGGGFLGLHSASGTERNWTWFKQMLGATFLRHPPFQPLSIHVLDSTHPAMKNLPLGWETKDECYYFKEINPSIRILAFTDISHVKEGADSTLRKPDVFGDRYPCVWCQEFEGGRIWYTSLGHDKKDFSNPIYLALITEGLKWVTNKPRPDYKRL